MKATRTITGPAPFPTTAQYRQIAESVSKTPVNEPSCSDQWMVRAGEYIIERDRAERNAKAAAQLAPMTSAIMLAMTGQVPYADRDSAAAEIGRALARTVPRRHNTVLFTLSVLIRNLAENLDDLQIGKEGRAMFEQVIELLDSGVMHGDECGFQVAAADAIHDLSST